MASRRAGSLSLLVGQVRSLALTRSAHSALHSEIDLDLSRAPSNFQRAREGVRAAIEHRAQAASGCARASRSPDRPGPNGIRPIVGRPDRTYLVACGGIPAGRSSPGTSMPETVSAATSLLSRPLMLIAAAIGIRARRNGRALGPLRHRGVLRDDRRRDRRLLMNAYSRQRDRI